LRKGNQNLTPEHLLLSYQSIHIFPAVPDGVEFEMENFAAEGGFLVSAKRSRNGLTTDVRIVSNQGGTCRLSNPWPNKTVEVLGGDGTPVAVTIEQSPQGHDILNFAAGVGQTYAVRPVGP
jgi:hypothetical protein